MEDLRPVWTAHHPYGFESSATKASSSEVLHQDFTVCSKFQFSQRQWSIKDANIFLSVFSATAVFQNLTDLTAVILHRSSLLSLHRFIPVSVRNKEYRFRFGMPSHLSVSYSFTWIKIVVLGILRRINRHRQSLDLPSKATRTHGYPVGVTIEHIF